jgi:hypothetical protein
MATFPKPGLAALCALPFLLAGPAQASDVFNAKVTQASPDKDGKVVVYLDTPRESRPACSTSSVTYSINATTAGGQAMLSAIYTALASDLPIDIKGGSVCTEYSNTESIGYVSLRRRGS